MRPLHADDFSYDSSCRAIGDIAASLGAGYPSGRAESWLPSDPRDGDFLARHHGFTGFIGAAGQRSLRENRSGAATIAAAGGRANAARAGHTLLLINPAHVLNDDAYEPAQVQFAPTIIARDQVAGIDPQQHGPLADGVQPSVTGHKPRTSRISSLCKRQPRQDQLCVGRHGNVC